jgi:hypothetical protein
MLRPITACGPNVATTAKTEMMWTHLEIIVPIW